MRSALLGSNLPTTISGIIKGSVEAQQLWVATLFTVTDLAGSTWAFNDRGYQINTAVVANGPVIKFLGNQLQPILESADSATGAADQTAKISFYPLFDNPLAANNNSLFLAGCHSGLFDGTFCSLYYAYMSGPGIVIDVVNIYSGWLGKIDLTRDKITWELNSILFQANIRIPKRTYAAPCTHALYDLGCSPGNGPSPGPNKANFGGVNTVKSIDGTLPQQIIHMHNNDATSAFSLGYMKFTSGLNINLVRTIKQSTGTGPDDTFMVLMSPLPNTPQIGDTLIAYEGCDKTQSTCVNKFGNLNNFGGFPYIPQETVFF